MPNQRQMGGAKGTGGSRPSGRGIGKAFDVKGTGKSRKVSAVDQGRRLSLTKPGTSPKKARKTVKSFVKGYESGYVKMKRGK